MSNPILNTTQKTCTMCYKDYRYKEISNLDKVVELACHHFCHISCISESLKNPENRQRKLTCCYSCTQELASSDQGANAFANQEIFQARLKEIREIYDYDNEVVEAISVLASLYGPLCNIYDSSPLRSKDLKVNQENKEQLFNSIYDFFMEKEEIKEDSIKVILQILGTMMIGDQVVRTVDDEAKRWKNISFEHWPDKIKQKGIFVRYKDEGISIRISANHLKKIADKFFGKDLASHYLQRAENFFSSSRSWISLAAVSGVAVVIFAKKFF